MINLELCLDKKLTPLQEEIATQFKKKNESLDLALDLHTRSANDILDKIEALQGSHDERNKIGFNYSTRINAYDKKIKELEGKRERAKAKFTASTHLLDNIIRTKDHLQCEARRITRKIRTIKRRRTQVNRFLCTNDEKAIEEFCENIGKVKDLINTNVPVSIISTEEGTRLKYRISWTTRNIHILDCDSLPLPFDFGQFAIEIRITLDLDGGFDNWSTLFVPKTPRNIGGRCHPHITTEGEPCLGNVSNPLYSSTKNMDIINLICLVDSYLTSYNPLDPFSPLYYWCSSKFHSSPCECGLMLDTQCGCKRCQGCSVLIAGPSEGPERKCGHCGTCCQEYHSTINGLTETYAHLKNLGINHSNCFNHHTILT